jgi:hypothetical protein
MSGPADIGIGGGVSYYGTRSEGAESNRAISVGSRALVVVVIIIIVVAGRGSRVGGRWRARWERGVGV